MSRDKSIVELLQSKGAIDKQGRFKSNVEFERNPALDRVWIPGLGSPRGTSVCMDALIASTITKMLGSRQAYIAWVRKAVEHIVEESRKHNKDGVAGLSRLVQREAVAYIRVHSAKHESESVSA